MHYETFLSDTGTGKTLTKLSIQETCNGLMRRMSILFELSGKGIITPSSYIEAVQQYISKRDKEEFKNLRFCTLVLTDICVEDIDYAFTDSLKNLIHMLEQQYNGINICSIEICPHIDETSIKYYLIIEIQHSQGTLHVRSNNFTEDLSSGYLTENDLIKMLNRLANNRDECRLCVGKFGEVMYKDPSNYKKA